MQILLNDLSLHGQFASISAFQEAIHATMQARSKLRQFGRELYCHRNITQAQVTHDSTMRQAVQQLDSNTRRAVMAWLTQYGPFWEDERLHDPDEYWECQGQIVTDTALGEAAVHRLNGGEYQTLSISPSNWTIDPLIAVWHRHPPISVGIPNHWKIDTLETLLKNAEAAIQSWQQLTTSVQNRCPNLVFTPDCFSPLQKQPFVNSAAQRIVELLETLNKLKACFDEKGQRTEEGHRIYQDHFTGQKAWFSDSSDSEKHEFKTELSFKYPEQQGEILFCPWHGKVKTPQFRIHFSWPIRAEEPLYVVYIGPKITKR